MPIGKNSIKRVANGGYSAVKSEAPDMQNSTVIANVSAEVVELMLPAEKNEEKTQTQKKSACGKSTCNKGTAKKTAAKKSTQKEKAPEVRDGFVRYSFGDSLPTHLL